MSILNLIGWSSSPNTPINELPDIFPFPIAQKDFVSIDVENIFARILTDVLERTTGIPDKAQKVLWDNCLASESKEGLVTMLSKAMLDKKELFLIYDSGIELIRKADSNEESQIREEYKTRADSKIGIYISFKNYQKSDMIKIYSALEYLTVASLYKKMNISKAVQVKVNDLRKAVGLLDKEEAKAQAKSIADALKCGKDVFMDSQDSVDSMAPDLTATNSSIEFISQKLSFYLGLPASYITGLAPKGLGDSGEGEAKAVERGLKNYYYSIIKPVIESLLKVNTTFKSEDFYGINTALETLKTFELTSNEFISGENKLGIINKVFGLPESSKGDDIQEPDPIAIPNPIVDNSRENVD